MSQIVEKMYSPSADILNVWMEKLFPSKNQGCINFGYWKDIKKPLTTKKRIESQRRLYFEMFRKFDLNCKTVLEVGCGRGHGVSWLSERGYEAFGIDVLPGQIEKSKAKYPDLAYRFQPGEAERIPFGNNYFDCVCSLEAAQHFKSFKIFCQESFRVLTSKGKLVVSTYFITNKSFIHDLEKIIPNNLEGFDHVLAVSEAIAFMQNSGFKVHIPPVRIGDEVFPLYSHWQKKRLGNTPLSALSPERAKWAGYYTGGGKESHPWYQAFKNDWIDYYILEGTKNEKAK
jgi:ubiquinone/menaquinone biosynthesis C-methylase UbiE